MPNQEIHNYIDEQTTPNTTDYLDLDADVGGGNFLSKKLTFSNLRKWLFKLVSQDVNEITASGSNLGAFFRSNNVLIFNINGSGSEITIPFVPPYNKSATYLGHIYNLNGSIITLDPNFITTENNPDITTTVGGYAQVWLTYHKKADNTEYWTANTINFT